MRLPTITTAAALIVIAIAIAGNAAQQSDPTPPGEMTRAELEQTVTDLRRQVTQLRAERDMYKRKAKRLERQAATQPQSPNSKDQAQRDHARRSSAPAAGREKQQRRQQTARQRQQRPFRTSNLAVRSLDVGGASVIGEITNRSGEGHDTALFSLSVYDRRGKLIDTTQVMVTNFERGQTRSFKALMMEVAADRIDSVKVQFDTSL